MTSLFISHAMQSTVPARRYQLSSVDYINSDLDVSIDDIEIGAPPLLLRYRTGAHAHSLIEGVVSSAETILDRWLGSNVR